MSHDFVFRVHCQPGDEPSTKEIDDIYESFKSEGKVLNEQFDRTDNPDGSYVIDGVITFATQDDFDDYFQQINWKNPNPVDIF